MGIDRPDFGDGQRTSWIVPAEPTVQVPTERHASWGDNRTSFLEQIEPEPDYLPAAVSDAELDPSLRATWEKEGGYERNLAQAQAAAANLCDRMNDPETFVFKFDNQLPERLQIAIIDRLRIPPAKGRGVAAIEAFADSLSDRDFDIFEDWLNELDDDEKRAIGRYFDGR